MELALCFPSGGSLQKLFLSRSRDTEHHEVFKLRVLCSGYDIGTSGKGDFRLLRVSDGMHWALATIDEKAAGNNLHCVERNLTADNLLEVHSYRIFQYNSQTLCLQLVDFIFLQLSTELKTTLENTENESLTPISEVVNETLAPGMGTAPLRLPRIPFLYGEAKAAPGIAPGLPVLNFELAKEVPSSPKTKIPYSDGLGDIPSPPRFARMGELYPEVWNMTCVEYLNYFKSLVPSSALSMGLGDCTGKSNTDRRIESEQVTVLEDNKPHSSCYESSTFNGTNHCKESADFYRTKTRYSNEIGGNDEYKSNPVENHSSHSNSRSIFNRDSLFFAKLQDHLVSEMAKRIQNLSARDIGKVHGRFLQSQKPPGSNPLKSCLKHQEVVHNKQNDYLPLANQPGKQQTSYVYNGDYTSAVPTPIFGKENHYMGSNHTPMPYGTYHYGFPNGTLPKSQSTRPLGETIHCNSNIEASNSIGSFDGQLSISQQCWRALNMIHRPNTRPQKYQVPHMAAPLYMHADQAQVFVDDLQTSSGKGLIYSMPTPCPERGDTFAKESTLNGCCGSILGVNRVVPGLANTIIGCNTTGEPAGLSQSSSYCKDQSEGNFMDFSSPQSGFPDWFHHQPYTSRAYPGAQWWP